MVPLIVAASFFAAFAWILFKSTASERSLSEKFRTAGFATENNSDSGRSGTFEGHTFSVALKSGSRGGFFSLPYAEFYLLRAASFSYRVRRRRFLDPLRRLILPGVYFACGNAQLDKRLTFFSWNKKNREYLARPEVTNSLREIYHLGCLTLSSTDQWLRTTWPHPVSDEQLIGLTKAALPLLVALARADARASVFK
jgi:hypothetical protein